MLNYLHRHCSKTVSNKMLHTVTFFLIELFTYGWPAIVLLFVVLIIYLCTTVGIVPSFCFILDTVLIFMTVIMILP